MFKFNKLVSIPSISGKEEKVIDEIKIFFEKRNFLYKKTNLKSFIFYKGDIKNKKNILIDSHIDEVGLMIINILDDGYLIFEKIGGIDDEKLVNQRVNVWNKDSSSFIQGVIVNSKELYREDETKCPKLIIDCALRSKIDVEDFNIGLGSSVTFATEVFDNGINVISKSVDNKLGVSLVLDLVNKMTFDFKNVNFLFSFSTQEEVGLRGARTVANLINPDLAIVVDISPVRINQGKIGDGTMLRHFDALTLYDRKIVYFLEGILIKNKISYQNFFSSGATNAAIINITNQGIPVIPIGLLTKYIHSSSSIFNKKDYSDTLEFFKLVIKELGNKDILNELLKK